MVIIYGILLHVKLFCCQVCGFFFGDLHCFVAKFGLLRYALLWEKILAKYSVRGEKMTNIMYGLGYWNNNLLSLEDRQGGYFFSKSPKFHFGKIPFTLKKYIFCFIQSLCFFTQKGPCTNIS